MKKLLSLALALALVLSLAACGDRTATSEQKEQTKEDACTFKLGTPLSYETEFTAEDGTVLLTEKYELPFLTLVDANGNEVDLSTDGTAKGDICDAFNGRMQEKNSDIYTLVQSMVNDATEQYGERTDESSEWYPYSFEYSIASTYMTDGVLSIVCVEGTDFGGAHPSTESEMWNFDLTAGEFMTLASLTGEANPLGEVLKNALSATVQDDISEQNLSTVYFDNYYEVVNDLVNSASFNFVENGMELTFDTYTLAPYYAGAQAFTIPYGEFWYALDSHTQSLLPLSQEDTVLADYQTAQIFWAWFNMSMPPIDVEDGIDLDSDNPLYRVKLGSISTLDELRALLCTRVSEELADAWLAGERIVERDGALYVTMGERGGNMTVGKLENAVTLEGEGGTLTQTVYRQDVSAETGDYALTGETEEISYPFTLSEGHAVFTSFDCPL